MALTHLNLAALCLAWYAFGVGVMMSVEGWDFLTANYVIMQIVTTIGYGDMAVSDSMHWFMALFVLSGCAVVANVVNEIVSKVGKRNTEFLRAKIRATEARLTHGSITDDGLKERYGHINKLIAASVMFAIYVFGGAVFFCTVEACSCGYGKSALEGCTPDNCHEKGTIKTFAHGVYMAVITLTTIGFGDYTPTSYLGRAFGLVWMILGVLACVRFINAIASFIDHQDQDKQKRDTNAFSVDVFKAVDKDSNGVLNHAQFSLWMLLKHGVVEMEDLAKFDELFGAMDRLDPDQPGITIEKLTELYSQGAGAELEIRLVEAQGGS